MGATQLGTRLGLTVATGLIYAGQAGAGKSTATLRSRIRGNHLGGTITGSTFRLTLASVLASPLNLLDGGGRALEGDGEARLSTWMRDHLVVAVTPEPNRARLSLLEDAVLARLNPPFNLQGMGPSPVRSVLTVLRRARHRPATSGARGVTAIEKRPEGWWVKVALDRAGKFFVEIVEMLGKGLLSFSSGAMPHLVRIAPGGRIERWPMCELSLTPSPASDDARIYSVKSSDLAAHVAAIRAYTVADRDDLRLIRAHLAGIAPHRGLVAPGLAGSHVIQPEPETVMADSR